jgi:hypothetical protein
LFPVNVLIIEALECCQCFYGKGFKIKVLARSGRLLGLGAIAVELRAADRALPARR